ncbi:MAG TPA: hypothetical protein VFE01_10365 [Terracidiphilus sp.]|jgi:hypothetical protein|nr:hypothetical protein [Terracidiphilus sp.]
MRDPPWDFQAVAAIGVVYFFEQYVRDGKRWHKLSRQCDYLERGIARLTGRWQGTGESGAEYGRDSHLYQEDLNVLAPARWRL